jgi:formate hydrogenlyase subunit 3/multisubunit Na+/H+ antiporter MnhD subunit
MLSVRLRYGVLRIDSLQAYSTSVKALTACAVAFKRLHTAKADELATYHYLATNLFIFGVIDAFRTSRAYAS